MGIEKHWLRGFDFRCEEITVDFFSMQADKLTWSLRVKI